MPTDEEVAAGVQAVREWPYQNHRVVLLPYVESNLAVFPEEFLGRMYFRLKKEGLLDISFPGMGLGHLNRFISYLSNVRLGHVVGCVKTTTKPRPVGWAFLNEVSGDDGKRKANFTFGFYREIHGSRQHVDLSMFYLKYWFDTFKIDQLYGTTLNPLALNYAKRFGFRKLCVLPKFFDGVDASLITLTPEAFRPHYESWKLTSTPPPVEATLTLV